MTTLGTVLRGMRSRALLSITSLVMMTLAVVGAVVGPAFQVAATQSYTLTRMTDAPAPLTALSFELRPSRKGDLEDAVAVGVRAVEDVVPRFYGTPEVTMLSGPYYRARDYAEFTYLSRDGVCELLEVRGRCPEGPDEVLINEDDLFSLEVGDRIEAPSLGRPRIVGVYTTPTTSDDWLFPSLLANDPQGFGNVGGGYAPGPVVVADEVFGDLPRRALRALLDSRLSVPDNLTEDQFDDLAAAVELAGDVEGPLDGGGTLSGQSEANAIDSVLADVRVQRDAARSAVAPAVVSLVLVALAMILRLQTASAALREPELALAALRGVGRRRTWVIGLTEPFVLVALSAPLGLLAGYAATLALARSSLRQGLAVTLPTASLVSAAAVVLVTAAVAAVAVGQGMGQTLGARLTGARRPGGGRTGLVVELVVVALAVLLPLSRLGTGSDGLGLTELLLPVALAVAAGLLVSRSVAAAARWWTEHRGGTRGRSLSAYVAARALARRAQGTLVILPVTAALAIAVFAVGVDSVADRWRDSVAATTAPGDEVWASQLDIDTTVRSVEAADPDGDWAMVIAAVGFPDVGPVVLVDADRMARVEHWSDQWLVGGGDAAAVAALVRPPAPLLSVAGRDLALTVEAEGSGTVRLEVWSATGSVYLRFPFGPGTSTPTLEEEDCVAGCQIRAIALEEATGPARITVLTSDNGPVAVAGAGWTVDPATGTGLPATVDGTTLVLEPDVVLVPAALVSPLRVIEGVGADETVVDGEAGTVVDLPSGEVPVEVTGRAESLPLSGPAAILADLTTVLAREEPSPALVEPAVLVRADAPASVTGALAAAGLARTADAVSTRRALDDTAYAQALRLYVIVGATMLLMALGGLLVSTAVQLPGRRRDAASLRVVGVGRRTVALASMWESLVVLGAAAVAGLAAGVAAQVVLLRSLSLGVVDDAATPRVIPDPDETRLVLLAGSVALVLVLVAVLTSVAVVRRARASTLREDAR